MLPIYPTEPLLVFPVNRRLALGFSTHPLKELSATQGPGLRYPRHVADTGLKQQILETLAKSSDRERALEQLCDDSPPLDPSRWTAKDHLAHLAHWRAHAVMVLDSARTAGEAPAVESEDEINARVYAQNRDRPAADVLAAAHSSYADLVHAVQASSEEDLLTPRAGRPGLAWEVIPGNGHAHTGQHLTYWYQEHGDERAAEEAQLWVRDTEEAAFPFPRRQAAAAYNLGCYYSLRGRADTALPLFERSFELDPNLKEWARSDNDLDRIRDHPGLKRLVG
jgi:tetratricopeptide (TPR) repeat protein